MKARKTMRTLPLIQEVMSQISSRFAPKTSDIKKVCYLLLSSLRAQNNWYCSGRRRLIFSWIKSTSSESTTGGTRSPTPPRCLLPPFFSCFNLLCYCFSSRFSYTCCNILILIYHCILLWSPDTAQSLPRTELSKCFLLASEEWIHTWEWHLWTTRRLRCWTPYTNQSGRQSPVCKLGTTDIQSSTSRTLCQGCYTHHRCKSFASIGCLTRGVILSSTRTSFCPFWCLQQLAPNV